jgi:predicted RNA-binding Zn-ribbon protein involved in translation (DUF1610 family)
MIQNDLKKEESLMEKNGAIQCTHCGSLNIERATSSKSTDAFVCKDCGKKS